jgi:hypothetical protein
MTPEQILGWHDLDENWRILDAVLTTDVGGGVNQYSPGTLRCPAEGALEGSVFIPTFLAEHHSKQLHVEAGQVFIEEKPLVATHKVIPIKAFDWQKMDGITRFIADHGAISFTLEDKKKQEEFFARFYSRVLSKFKYNLCGRFNTHRSYPAPLTCVVTFVSLLYGVPMFADPRQVDGMVVRMSGHDCNGIRGETEVLRMDALVANQESGVFKIDGGQIWPSNLICVDHMTEMARCFRTCSSEPVSGGRGPRKSPTGRLRSKEETYAEMYGGVPEGGMPKRKKSQAERAEMHRRIKRSFRNKEPLTAISIDTSGSTSSTSTTHTYSSWVTSSTLKTF